MYILVEAQMSADQAKKVFGIEKFVSADELKKLYKSLSMQNHPDKQGGSLEKMKDINQAYDILKKVTVGADKDTGNIFDTIRKRKAENDKIFIPKMKKMFEDAFDEKAILDYFSFMNQDFSVTTKYVTYDQGYDTLLTAVVTISNPDKTTVIETKFQIKYNDNSSGGLSYSGIDEKDVLYSVDLLTSFYHNNKKIKLSQSNYEWKVGTKKLANFAEIYPKAKLEKALNNSGSKKFKRADMELGLARELNASFDKDNIYLYVFGKEVKFYIVIRRLVMMKIPAYYPTGIQAIHPSNMKYKYYAFDKVSFVLETEETFRKLVDSIKKVAKDASKMDLVQNYEVVCKAFEKALQIEFPRGY